MEAVRAVRVGSRPLSVPFARSFCPRWHFLVTEAFVPAARFCLLAYRFISGRHSLLFIFRATCVVKYIAQIDWRIRLWRLHSERVRSRCFATNRVDRPATPRCSMSINRSIATKRREGGLPKSFSIFSPT